MKIKYNNKEFITESIESIINVDSEISYNYVFRTKTFRFKTTANHEWLVFNKETKDLEMVKTKDLVINKHELLIQK